MDSDRAIYMGGNVIEGIGTDSFQRINLGYIRINLPINLLVSIKQPSTSFLLHTSAEKSPKAAFQQLDFWPIQNHIVEPCR